MLWRTGPFRKLIWIFRMHVDNEHASNLTFQRFAYNLQLGNTEIITGVAEELNDTIAGSSEEGSTEGSSNENFLLPVIREIKF